MAMLEEMQAGHADPLDLLLILFAFYHLSTHLLAFSLYFRRAFKVHCNIYLVALEACPHSHVALALAQVDPELNDAQRENAYLAPYNLLTSLQKSSDAADGSDGRTKHHTTVLNEVYSKLYINT